MISDCIGRFIQERTFEPEFEGTETDLSSVMAPILHPIHSNENEKFVIQYAFPSFVQSRKRSLRQVLTLHLKTWKPSSVSL